MPADTSPVIRNIYVACSLTWPAHERTIEPPSGTPSGTYPLAATTPVVNMVRQKPTSDKHPHNTAVAAAQHNDGIHR